MKTATGPRLGKCLALAAALFAPGSLAAIPDSTESWIRADSPGFTFYSNAEPSVLSDLAYRLELLHSVLEGLNPARPLASSLPTSIFVFRDRATFAPYKPRSNGRPAAVAGFFIAHPHAGFVAVHSDPQTDRRGVILHEYIHGFLRENLPQAPLWLNEGLAEFYSTFDSDEEEARIGQLIDSHLLWLRQQPAIPLRRLLETETTSHTYNDRRKNPGFYAQSWALVHYLLLGGEEPRAELASYLALLEEGVEPLEAFDLAFGASYRTLERKISRHLQDAAVEPLSAPVEAPAGDLLQVTPLSRSDTLFHLGWLLAHQTPARVDEAQRHVDAALRIDPHHAPSFTAQGYLDALEGDHQSATYHFERAAELGADDYLLHFLRANSLARIVGTWPSAERWAGDGLALIEEARVHYRESLRHESGFVEAWAGLGATYVTDPDPSTEGLRALRTAYEKLATRPDVIYNLAVLSARLGRRQDAEDLIAGPLSEIAEPIWVERASEALLQADLAAAERLLRQGRTEEAIALMEDVLRNTTDGGLAMSVTDRLDLLSEQNEDRTQNHRERQGQ